MKCKFCLTDIEENVSVCPACGKSLEISPEEETPALETALEEPEEETPGEKADETAASVDEEEMDEIADEAPAAAKKKSKTWRIVLAIAGGAVLLAVLVCAVLYGLGVNLKPRENDVLYKDSYTVEDAVVSKNADVVIATVGDQKLTNGELQVYYWLGVYNFLDYYGGYLSAMGIDIMTPLDQQVYDPFTNMNYQHLFLQGALEEWYKYVILVQMAEDAGFELSAEQQNYLDSFRSQIEALATEDGFESVSNFIAEAISPSSTMEDYISYNRVNYVGLAYYDTLYEGIMPTQQEVEAYYTQHEAALRASGFAKENGNYSDVRHILIKPEGGTVGENGVTTYSEDAWEACRVKAQEILDGYLAGDATEDAFAALAKEKSQDPGSGSNGGLYTGLTAQTNFVTEFKDWYLDENRQPGDTGLVKTVHGYHIMYFSASTPIWEYEAKTQLLAENTTKMLEDAKKQWPMQVNYKKIVLGAVDFSQK